MGKSLVPGVVQFAAGVDRRVLSLQEQRQSPKLDLSLWRPEEFNITNTIVSKS